MLKRTILVFVALTSVTLRAAPNLNLGVRFDADYLAGGIVQQGFSIPSARMTGYGSLSESVQYRLSLGQTREVSTVLLPQVLPVEAYVRMRLSPIGAFFEKTRTSIVVGMFTPDFNPRWTPDLGSIAFPDYLKSHAALFLFRDIGAELSIEPIPGNLQFSFGVTNGNGVIALNTNSSRAYTAFGRGVFEWEGFRLGLGAGFLSFSQGASGSINFKSNWSGNVFVTIERPEIRLLIQPEIFAGYYEETSRAYSPHGAAVSVMSQLFSSVDLFGLFEILEKSPARQMRIRRWQLGPTISFSENLKLFSYYESEESGAVNDDSFHVRLRLVL